jgi:TetR/AcrR family transcriptional regulator, mexJK operon transcriptional repressor
MASMMDRSGHPDGAVGGKAESILAAGKRMFLESGFGAVSMDAIAREAGVSKATVYAHFAGKEELFGAVIGRECERYFAEFSADELDPGEPRASLTTLGRRFLGLLLSPDAIALHRLILGEVSRFPALGKVFWRAGPERNLTQIETFLRAAAAAGSLNIGDPRLAAEQFVGLLRGETQLRHLLRLEAKAEGDQPKTRALIDAAVDTFLRAFERRKIMVAGQDAPQPRDRHGGRKE